MVCRREVAATVLAAFIAAAVFTESGATLFPLQPHLPGDEEGMMMPYDRISLDDCHMRYWKDGNQGLVAPAYGQPALLREFAHIAAIGWTDAGGKVEWACGGSLIWENYILTAAHCAANDEDVAPDVARMGDLNINSIEDDDYAQQRRIVNIIRHPQHRFSARYYDIALLKLDRNIEIHETVAPACLWLDDEVRFPKLFSAGWGRTGVGEKKTDILLKVELEPMSNENCSQFYASERGLRSGLHPQHLCAGDEKMDTCPGDSGGPLHIKLLSNAKMTPFLVGVTSFGKPCGQSNPGVYVRVSTFGDWIIETLQREGETEATVEKFEPWACVLRYVHVREYEDDVVVGRSNNYEEYNSDKAHLVRGDSPHRVTIRWPASLSPARSNCSGVLIERNAVVTLADCATHLGATPWRVILSNGNYLDVAETIIHPSYSQASGRYYNNIAVLKLTSGASFPPTCVWYHDEIQDPQFEVLGRGRADLIGYNRDQPVTMFDPSLIAISPRVAYHPNTNCSLAQQYRRQLACGLQREHICFQSKPFVVPGTCQQLRGGPIEREMWRFERYFNYAYGLNLFGRDCGFGEPAVALRLNAHRPWLESLLLPAVRHTPTGEPVAGAPTNKDAVIFINPDLQLSDRCSYAGGVQGVCVTQDRCPAIRLRMQNNQPVTLCSTGSIVCCPLANVKKPPTAISQELDDCEQRYRHLRKQRQERWDGFQPLNRRLSHTVEIGWEDGADIAFRCLGYLISTKGVVASASCLIGEKVYPAIVRVGGLYTHPRPDVALHTVAGVEIHPDYNETSYLNNIAIVKLTLPVQPTVTAFPGCVWQNVTHTPVQLVVHGIGSSPPIHPVYRSDCDARFRDPFTDPRQICMIPGMSGPAELCFVAGSPIVWMKGEGKNLFTEYLVNLYSHGRCNSTNLRVVHRVSMYVDWFKEVLE